ncbi:MAG: peptidyl-prolyl cis-trans isomerase [Ignavibacteriales bacterium]
MAMMARMRSLAPWFILGVGGLFVLFMVLSDSKISNLIGKRSNDVGSVNGEKISYQEFSDLFEQYRQYQQQQTGQEIPESQLDMLRDNVWESLVNQKLVAQKIKEFGINVSDDEIKDVLLGPNPPASVTRFFTDSLGNFNRDAYESAIFNPQNKEAMKQVEEQVRQQLLQQKLQNTVTASVMVSESDIKQKFIEQNTKVSADYIFVDAATIPETQVKVTDDDIEKYYNKNKENYKIEEQRKLKYVLFKKEASKGDTSSVRDNLVAIVNKMKTDTSSFKTYVNIYSEQPYSKDTVELTRIPKGAQEAIAKAAKGNILGPLATTEGFIVYKVNDVLPSKNPVVRASHILISFGQNKDDNSQAMKVYERLLKGESFAELAAKFSGDPGSARNGGDLGWFGKGAMVKEFENACFTGQIGQIQKPVKTQYGWHIIKVTGKSDKKFVVEKIVNKIQPSASTVDQLYENANDFSYLADKDGFEKVAKEFNYNVVETTPFAEKAAAIPGLGVNKAITVFAFENGVGDISPVFKVPLGYAVVTISEEIKEGYKPLEEVKEQVKMLVMNEKKVTKSLEIAKNIRKKLNENPDFQIAKQIFPSARVDTAYNFSPTGFVPNLGREFAFTNKVMEMEPNKISEAFAGTRGSFVVKVKSRTPFDKTAYSLQRNSIRDNLLSQKKSQIFNQWLAQIKEESDIVDERYLFFR